MKKQVVRAMQRDSDVEIISHEIPFQGYFRVEKYKLRHKLFAGNWGQPMEREVFERGHAAAVLPYDPKLNKVVLIEQFRIGALRDECSPWLLEVVAGVIDHGETPTEVCRREAEEEAGLKILELIPISHYWVSPGGCTESMDLFCGKVDASQAGGIHGLDHENEDIKVHVFDIQDAFEMVRSGKINNQPAIIALQWLELMLIKNSELLGT
ncbi:MAG: NUDIX domain-containing protein [Gammaproteobacteria bacterium]|jgi:ADP-ribose pyrophosphatase